MTRVLDAYTAAPRELQLGDTMLFVIKAVITRGGYRLYRCSYPWPDTGSTLHHVRHVDREGIPQGSRIPNEQAVADAIFPILRCFEVEPDNL